MTWTRRIALLALNSPPGAADMANRTRLGCVFYTVTAYLLFAVYAWWDFTRTNHDGLANLGLFVVTAPVALVQLIASEASVDLVPSGHGYLMDHALYYVPAVIVTATLIGVSAYLVRRWWRSIEDGEGRDRNGSV